MKVDEDGRRPYRMTARAAAAAATGERILDAAVAVFYERADLPLGEVASRAGVTVQTVIRRFGGRDGLFAAALQRESGRVAAQREAQPGDLAGVVRVLLEHYEEAGDRILTLLAVEDRNPVARQVTEPGRQNHRAWCEQVFEPALRGLGDAVRERRLAQLVALTDVQTWKLLRRDAGLPRGQVALALHELLEPLMGDR